MVDLNAIRKVHIVLMDKTAATLANILSKVDHETATTLRDGADGWTVTEVVCHLRDWDEIFLERAQRILHEDRPTLVPRDHEQMAIEGRYNEQDVHEALAQLRESRQRLIAFFEALSSEDWLREGIHPEIGPFSLTRAVMQIGHHDVNHLEQITRILAQA